MIDNLYQVALISKCLTSPMSKPYTTPSLHIHHQQEESPPLVSVTTSPSLLYSYATFLSIISLCLTSFVGRRSIFQMLTINLNASYN